MKSRLYSPLFLSILSLLFSCAEVAGPPGGPRDETAPVVSSTIPLSDNVNTIMDNNITVSFSERIEPKSIAGAIFISPRPDGDLEYKWKKNSLAITLPDSFETNKTYVVTIGTQIRDLRGNRMEESFSFAFSTGESIDEGSVNGFVFREDKPASSITVGLFDYSIIDSLSLLDSLYPPYITQSGKNGEFAFNYLPEGKYLTIAYDDKNKNQFLNYPAEMFGLADRFVILDSNKQFPTLNIKMASKDTTSLSIISTTHSSDNLIKVRLSKSISADSVYENLDQIHLVFSDNQDSLINASSVRESSGGDLAVFNLYFANLAEGSYRLRIGKGLLSTFGNDSLYIESSEFLIQPVSDSLGPQINFSTISQKKVFPDETDFEIGFSEPMNQNIYGDSSIMIYDSENVKKNVTFNWIDYFRIGVTLVNPKWGQEYFVVLNEKDFSDLAGNNFGDSITVYKIYTYNADSLGEASGVVENKYQVDPSAVAYITFVEVSGKNRFTKKAIDNKFNFRLPPGEYLLSGFTDSNNNGLYDTGSLIPFRLAETMAKGADTIRVRARFETTGLVFQFK